MTDNNRTDLVKSFRLGELADTMAARGDVGSLLVRQELTRYYWCLAAELAEVHLTEPEALAVIDATNGWYWEQSSIPLLWAEVDDAVRIEGLAEKWGIDGPALVEKLRALTYTQCLAVLDATVRFWRRQGQGETNEESLRAVGLLR